MEPNAKAPVKACHVCHGARIYYLFSMSGHRVVRCSDCGLVFLNPQPGEAELARMDGGGGLPGNNEEEQKGESKQAAAGLCLSEIRRYRGPDAGRLLEIGCGGGDFLALAEADGWRVTGIENSAAACEIARRRLKAGQVLCGKLEQMELKEGQFDLCVVSGMLEHARSPLDSLGQIHQLLAANGTLLIVTPSIDSWPARVLRQKWMEFQAGHLTYFDRQTLQTALFKSGFRDIIVQPAWNILNSDSFPVTAILAALHLAARPLPGKTRFWRRRMAASRIIVLSRKEELRPQPVLSVIVPAYNEAKTLQTVMEALLRKELPGLRMEIILVESNSTDGTRPIALKYQNDPRVKLVLEEAPHGKGRAVRAGLRVASGDYVLIQDADLEYDLEDYDALLEQLLAGRCAFVLGSRHGGRGMLKLRKFAGEHGLGLVFNFGHWFFTTLVNVLFLQRLRDPFTMFKVFRRDCLFGLEFECNGFDFDYELLIKLIRKGYRPVELPVNYRSRSYREGKKVRMFRDPLTWLKVLVWLRWIKIDPMMVAEQARRADRAINPLTPARR